MASRNDETSLIKMASRKDETSLNKMVSRKDETSLNKMASRKDETSLNKIASESFFECQGVLRERTLLLGVCFYGPQRMKKKKNFLSSKGV